MDLDFTWESRAKEKEKFMDSILRDMELVNNFAFVSNKYKIFRLAELQDRFNEASESLQLPGHLEDVINSNLEEMKAARVQEWETTPPIHAVMRIMGTSLGSPSDYSEGPNSIPPSRRGTR